jgi:hypothetical protein
MKETRLVGLTVLDQQGMALVSALLMLLVLSLMAIALSMDSSMNVRIAGYQRLKAQSFSFADSGLRASTDLLEDNIYEVGWDNAVPFQYPNLTNYAPPGDIQIVDDGVFYMDDNPGTCGEGDTTMRMTGVIQADVAVQRLIAKTATGGALQVAAGYAGIGKSQAAGGTHILYNLRSTGVEDNGTCTEVAMHYRVVTR